MQSIIITVISSILLGIIGWFTGRISIKTKTQESIIELQKKVKRHDEAIPLILECHLVQLNALKDGHMNSECDNALNKLTQYLINK